MRAGCAVGLLALAACTFGSSSAHAIGYAEAGNVSVDATGYLRVTSGYLLYPELPPPLPDQDETLMAAVSRLILRGGLSQRLSYEANFFLQMSRTPGASIGNSFSTAGSFASPYRAPQLAWSFWQSGNFGGQLGIDRLRFEIDAAPITLTMGRFPINYGVTNVLSPNDFFAPFGATAVNTVFKPGVDALRLNWSIDELSNIELVRTLGYEQDDTVSWRQSALVGRVSTVVWELQGALIAGKLAQRWVAGGSLQGGLGPLTLRAEGHASFADSDGDGALDGDIPGVPTTLQQRDKIAARFAAGLDTQFEWQNTAVGAEYAFFSDGAVSGAQLPARSLTRFPDDLPFSGKHYLGATVGGEIIPIVRYGLTALVNLGDGSGLASAALQYEAADEMSLAAGVLLPWGRRPTALPETGGLAFGSELGSAPATAFVESRVYF